MQVQLKNETIDIVVEHRNRKTVEIQIKPPGVVKVLVPKRVVHKDVVSVLQSKQEWIEIKLAEVREKEKHRKEYTFTNGENFLYLGERFPLRLVKDETVPIPMVELVQGGLCVWSDVIEAEQVRRALETWYRRQTSERVLHYIEKHKMQLNCMPVNVKVKEQKKRWGSCSSRGNLMFNWRLSMAPERVLEYVVVHEMCHLIYFNHSKDFWHLVESCIPDYKIRKKWLKTHGMSVYL
ncbi:protein of unknown function DUF45 [Alkaliphilus metalliredigens QYMF]|uniref:YgjP-like metallopeptidase domain-containing protein n=1 Tax=Alkaliphilus metalliredigens (strain QYMF) TaxID=293826 RepID=A6TVW7_ALKMQ|nr:SprT family zinc-dependent metalloprotease [Alkaliphilus metalliredigens]ABR50335.1 protein of unknown function DUF45 [Alkaliphilus metalliredigens QYMF]